MAIIQSYDAFLGFYAVATADGRLRVWESLTEGGNLKVNFTFKSNLADGFFSISWSNCLVCYLICYFVNILFLSFTPFYIKVEPRER
jgi:hypothetical protein